MNITLRIKKKGLKLFAVSFCVLLSVSGFSQKSRFFKTNMVLEGKECATDTSARQLVFEIFMGTAYRTMGNQTVHKCPLSYSVPATFTGKFKITLFSEGYESKSAEIEITKASGDTVEIPDLLLKKKVMTLQDVIINSGQQKFVQFTADKTIVQVKNNGILANGNVYQTISKLPGVISDLSGTIMHNGKQMAVWIDGQPTDLSGQDLLNFLNALPANAVEKIEIIGNPGAAYDANSAGGIINIITGSGKLKGISGTISVNYLTNKFNKVLPSLQLNGKSSKITWQMLTTYSYMPGSNENSFSNSYRSFSPSFSLERNEYKRNSPKSFFTLAGFSYAFTPKISLAVKYSYLTGRNNFSLNTTNLIQNNTNPFSLSEGSGRTGNNKNEWIALYKQKFDAGGKTTLSVQGLVTELNNNGFNSSEEKIYSNLPLANSTFSIVNNDLKQKITTAKADMEHRFGKGQISYGAKYSAVDYKNTGHYNLSNADPSIISNPVYTNTVPYQYKENTSALYFNANKNINAKLDFSVGMRMEHVSTDSKLADHTIFRDTSYTNLFPDIRFLYKINPVTNFTASYSKKISQPNYSQLDPNISGYTDSILPVKGNPLLLPGISHIIEAGLTVFSYANISVSYSYNKYPDFIVFESSQNNISAVNTNKTFPNAKTYSLNAGIPVPFKIFTDGFSFFKNSGNLNIDEINFFYLNFNLLSTKVTGADDYISSRKPFVFFSGYSQIILPEKVKLNIYYTASKGVYNIYKLNNYQKNLSLSLSKSFLHKNLKVSLSAYDILNSAKTSAMLSSPYLQTTYLQKTDSRMFSIGLALNFGKFALLHKAADVKNNETENKRLENTQGIKISD